MTITEKITDPEEFRFVDGEIPVEYLYTAGIAGERFFSELRKGRLFGARCEKCDLLYLPPRTYCEQCFSRLTKWTEVPTKGTLHSYTVAYRDLKDNKLTKPEIYGFVKFNGVHGGLVHKIEADEKNLKIGMDVEAVFKPPKERTGSILDIRHFKPR